MEKSSRAESAESESFVDGLVILASSLRAMQSLKRVN